VIARAALAAAAAAAGLALAACGTPSPDLFIVKRTGSVPGANLELLVSDTSVRCNGDDPRELSSAQILTARELLEDLKDVQDDGGPPREPPARIFRFRVLTEEGTLTFGDTATRPDVLPRVARFTRTVAQDLCGLRR
jgi:hypothetical protein